MEEADTSLGIRPFGGGNPDPYNDGTRNVVRFVHDKARHINRCVGNLLVCNQVVDKGTHSTPDGVERGTQTPEPTDLDMR